MLRVMLVPGAQSSKYFPNTEEKFRFDPEARALVSQAQTFLQGVEVDGQPLLLQGYCMVQNKNAFSARYQIVAEHMLIFIWSWALWERSRQHAKITAFLGQSYGLWIAAFLGGLCDFETAVGMVKQRLLICTAVSGDSILIRKKEAGSIDFASLQKLCEQCGNVWLAAINHQEQGVVSGTPEGIAKIKEVLEKQGIYKPIDSMRVGPPWHTLLLMQAAEKVKKNLPPASKLSNLAISICCLNKDGKLVEVWEKEEVVHHMLEELTQPRNFLEMVRQLPLDTEYAELVVHKNPYLTTTVQIIRDGQS